MNKGIITLIGLLCAISTSWASDYEITTFVEDTVIIEVGDSKIIVVVNSPEDLKKLEEFDINQMLADLNTNIAEDSLQMEQVVLADSIGENYKREEELVYYGENKERLNFNDFDLSWDNESESENSDEESVNTDDFKRTTSSFNIDLGMNNWIQEEGFPDANGELYAIKPWGSWYVALSHTNSTKITGPLSIDWGGNVSWYNWKLENRDVRIIKGDNETTFVQEANIDGQKSKLVGTYMNASLVPMLDFGREKKSNNNRYFNNKYERKGFRVGLGGYAGYRIASWTKFVYEEGGDKKKDKQKGNYYLNNFRYGIRGVLGYKAMDLFVNYDLNSVFANNRGPKLNAVSFGIIL